MTSNNITFNLNSSQPSVIAANQPNNNKSVKGHRREKSGQSEAAVKKMGSLKSLSLRSYVMMRVLNNNFNYTFVLDRNIRRPQKGLAYFPINRIYNGEMTLLFDAAQIHLVGKEKKRYCQTKTLQLMKQELELHNYNFSIISTKKAEKDHLSEYQNLTNEKIRSFEWKDVNGDSYKFEMEMLENGIGQEEYNNVLNSFKATTMNVIICNNGNEGEIIRDMCLEEDKVEILKEKCYEPIEMRINEYNDQNTIATMLTMNTGVNTWNVTQNYDLSQIQIPNQVTNEVNMYDTMSQMNTITNMPEVYRGTSDSTFELYTNYVPMTCNDQLTNCAAIKTEYIPFTNSMSVISGLDLTQVQYSN